MLCDFGISMYVEEDENSMSLTYREGTVGYMSPEMEALKKGGYGQVNLYKNDLYGLAITLNEMDRMQKDQPKSDVPSG